ncbi:FAD/NAD(P)-binding domain-containing protein [Dentipellis sp. KUC8613]|nr:FAD/NAD(P)-binding domain-containing protein [Dentipellis sp. KUC8613]
MTIDSLRSQPASDSPFYADPSPLALHIVIIGCGIGGLAAALTLSHALPQSHITVLEAAHALTNVGAGIVVSPNASRLLIRWGLGPALADAAVRPEGIVFRRYATGERVGYSKWGERIERAHGAPYLQIHRADYHGLLLGLVNARHNVTIRLAATVVEVQPEPGVDGGPNVTLAGGEVLTADLVIGADGVKSKVQTVVTGRPNAPRATGDAAYRTIIPTEKMMQDPDLRSFVETPEMTAWMAPNRHLMAYCISGRREYNFVLLHPDDGSEESWSAVGDVEKMREQFADFEPRVQKLMSFVSSTLRWRLMDRAPLDRWIHPSGRVALLGDACHAMLPYRGQGAGMAVEDAAVLGSLLSHMGSLDELPVLLQAYEDLRLPRCTEIQQSSSLNRHIFHMQDGPEQEARDAAMRQAMEIEMAAGNPNQWADRSKNEGLFSYDADKEAEKWWTGIGRAMLEKS